MSDGEITQQSSCGRSLENSQHQLSPLLLHALLCGLSAHRGKRAVCNSEQKLKTLPGNGKDCIEGMSGPSGGLSEDALILQGVITVFETLLNNFD